MDMTGPVGHMPERSSPVVDRVERAGRASRTGGTPRFRVR